MRTLVCVGLSPSFTLSTRLFLSCLSLSLFTHYCMHSGYHNIRSFDQADQAGEERKCGLPTLFPILFLNSILSLFLLLRFKLTAHMHVSGQSAGILFLRKKALSNARPQQLQTPGRHTHKHAFSHTIPLQTRTHKQLSLSISSSATSPFLMSNQRRTQWEAILSVSRLQMQ